MSWIGRKLGISKKGEQPRSAKVRQEMRARYESAETNHENEGLWRFTDYLSAKAANSFQIRRTLKIRSRYEASNNSYFRGMINTMSSDLIGKGPRLQCRTASAKTNRIISERWHTWARAVKLADKLRLMAKAKVTDGEGFGVLVTNRNLRMISQGLPPQQAKQSETLDVQDAVQLDVVPLESDQITTPDPGFIDYFWVDGIVLDRLGNPVEYHILRHHPGDYYIPQLNPLIYDRWKPQHVLHWFRKDRPGQVRGIPEITPALELFAQLRRYTKAVISAAETAADHAAVIESEAPANQGAQPFDPLDHIHYERGMMTLLPWGMKLSQLKSEQPATTYEMFVRVILREIARCLDLPLNVAMGDSSQYNFASGRLDHLGYHRQQDVDHQNCDEDVLDKIFTAWIDEAVMIEGYLPDEIQSAEQVPHRWFWDARETIQPLDDANVEQKRLETGTETLTSIYASRGEDWQTAIEHRAQEIATCYQLATKYGIPVETLLPKTTTTVTLKKDETEDLDDNDAQKPEDKKDGQNAKSKQPAV